MRIPKLSLLLLPLFCCSCSTLLLNFVPTKIVEETQPGAKREALTARLGRPHHSDNIPISPTATRFPTNGVACIREVYHVSGLIQIQGDPFSSDGNVYPAIVITSVGIIELFMFPYVAVDLAALSLRDYEFATWFDCSDGLIAFERKRRKDD